MLGREPGNAPAFVELYPIKCAVAMSTSAMADDQIKKFVAHRNFLSVVIVRLHVRPVRARSKPSGCPTRIIPCDAPRRLRQC